MAKNEKAVKGFIAATIKGWKDVIADNKVGIAAAKKKDPLIDEALETERLQISLQTNILTPYVKANGMGDVDPARFARSVALVSDAFGLAPRRRRTRSSPTSSCRPRRTGWSRSDGRNVAFVELKSASLTYRLGKETTLALADATFGIEKGEFIAVVGPSGCGKSTIMKLVTGLMPATQRRGPGAGRVG